MSPKPELHLSLRKSPILKHYQFSLALSGVLLLGTIAYGQPKSIVIGIDGLGFGNHGFLVADTPYMDRLINGTWQKDYKGRYCDEAFAGGVLGTLTQQPTSSGPGWSTILTGVWADNHKVVDNDFSNPNFEDYPTYIETLEEIVANLRSASFVMWTPINKNILSTVDDANSRIDFCPVASDEETSDIVVAEMAIKFLSTVRSDEPVAAFVHFGEVDTAGHAYGGNSPNYETKIEETDMLVGLLLTAIAARPNFESENWQIIVTSDHGHLAVGGHGGQSELERRIPLIITSKHVTQGQLSDQGQRVSEADVAATVLDHFQIVNPKHYQGKSRARGTSHLE